MVDEIPIPRRRPDNEVNDELAVISLNIPETPTSSPEIQERLEIAARDREIRDRYTDKGIYEPESEICGFSDEQTRLDFERWGEHAANHNVPFKPEDWELFNGVVDNAKHLYENCLKTFSTVPFEYTNKQGVVDPALARHYMLMENFQAAQAGKPAPHSEAALEATVVYQTRLEASEATHEPKTPTPTEDARPANSFILPPV